MLSTLFGLASGTTRLAVAIVLAYSKDTLPHSKSFWSHETTLCTVLQNLEATVQLVERSCSIPDAQIEPMILTLKNLMPPQIVQFFEDAGVLVRDVPEADKPLLDDGKINDGTPWLQAIKVHVVRLVEFQAILVVDCDIFLPVKFSWDVFGELLNSESRWILQKGDQSPINAGFIVVRPEPDMAVRLDEALNHGYRPRDDFYGGAYPPSIERLGKNRYWDKSGWIYIGSNTDQGLLLHLVAYERQEPETLIRNLKKIGLLHLAGVSPKTWYPDPLLDTCEKSERKRFANVTERQNAIALCIGTRKTSFEYFFWLHWTNLFHNQTWSSKTSRHLTCDRYMAAELTRRRGILGNSVYDLHPRDRFKRA